MRKREVVRVKFLHKGKLRIEDFYSMDEFLSYAHHVLVSNWKIVEVKNYYSYKAAE